MKMNRTKRRVREQEDRNARLNKIFNLRLTKLLVESMGGKMWMESEGYGTDCTIWFRLPRKHVEQEQR